MHKRSRWVENEIILELMLSPPPPSFAILIGLHATAILFQFSFGDYIVLFLALPNWIRRTAQRIPMPMPLNDAETLYFAPSIAQPLHNNIHCFLINSHQSRLTFGSLADRHSLQHLQSEFFFLCRRGNHEKRSSVRYWRRRLDAVDWRMECVGEKTYLEWRTCGNNQANRLFLANLTESENSSGDLWSDSRPSSVDWNRYYDKLRLCRFDCSNKCCDGIDQHINFAHDTLSIDCRIECDAVYCNRRRSSDNFGQRNASHTPQFSFKNDKNDSRRSNGLHFKSTDRKYA